MLSFVIFSPTEATSMSFIFTRRWPMPTRRAIGVSTPNSPSRKNYPEHLCHIRYKNAETGKTLVFITNNFVLSAATICALDKTRWQVELFFKWIKQHLRIKKFYGNSENAVKSQIWIDVSVDVLVAVGHL